MNTQPVQTGEPLRSGFEEDRRWVRADPTGWWRRWLADAPHDGRGLRRWLLWIQWTGRTSAADRARYAMNLLLLPIFSVKGALIYVRKYGGRVARDHGAGLFTQFRGLVRTQLGARLPPIEYYKLQLYLSERQDGIRDYFKETNQILHLLRNRLPDAPDRMVFRAKRLFEDWCRDQGLPTAHNLMEVLGDDVLYRSSAPIPAGDLFSKPSNGSLGIGVGKWRHNLIDGRSVWRGDDGAEYEFTELETELKRQSREAMQPFVLQPCLVNHPVVRGLGNGSLCTLRVMTVRRYPETANPLLMVLRIAIGDRSADNFDLGGIATPIDLETGRCGKAIAKRGDYPLERLAVNPESGAIIEGLELPYWREVIALAVRAHTLLQYSTPVVGWDIAVLEDGPILIEANGLPCPYAAQMPTGLPLGRTQYAGCLVSSLQTAFGLDHS